MENKNVIRYQEEQSRKCGFNNYIFLAAESGGIQKNSLCTFLVKCTA